MKGWKLVAGLSVCVGMVLGGLFGYVVETSGGSTSGPAGPVGRYAITAHAGNAYLVDTSTGCIWHKKVLQVPVDPVTTKSRLTRTIPAHTTFQIISVEGLVDIPSGEASFEQARQKLPAACHR